MWMREGMLRLLRPSGTRCPMSTREPDDPPGERGWPRRPDNPERLAAFTRTANARRCAKEGREAPAADPASPLYRGRRGFGHRR